MKFTFITKAVSTTCLLVASLTSCATIVNTPTQSVPIRSTPSNADVIIDGFPCGQTPIVATLERKQNHVIELKKPGYEDYTFCITKQMSGAFFGNIILGGPLGMIVDAVTGSMYKLTPKAVNLVLAPNNCNQQCDSLLGT